MSFSKWLEIIKEKEEQRKRDEQDKIVNFQLTGRLYPNQFIEAGDKLIQVCPGWRWKPSLNPSYQFKYLPSQKQFLIYQKALCKKRLQKIVSVTENIFQTEDGDQVTVLQSPQMKEDQQDQQRYEDFRFYTLYIIYDDYYHVPRIFFSMVNIQGNLMSNELIAEDIQNQYLERTFTLQQFPFIENARMASIHPCRHHKFLKGMSDIMRQNGQKIPINLAMLIFLKLIQVVAPKIQFERFEISLNSEYIST